MKIALVVPGGVDASGTERVIPAFLWLIERMARRHEVHVFALHQQPEPAEWPLLGAKVHNIGTGPGRRRRFFSRVAVEHRVAPFDVIHAMFGGPGMYAAGAGWRHHTPVLLHLTGGELLPASSTAYGQRSGWRSQLGVQFAVAGANRVTVPSRYMQELAAARGIHTSIVPLGVALDRWPARPPVPRDARQPARLLHIADLKPVKDQTTILRAVAQLRERGVACELDIAGFDTTAGALRRSPAAARVAGVTRWHGVLGRTELRALTERADVLVHASRHEAGALAVLEAAVAGVPTVGTPVGHIPEWAPHAAVAIPIGDPAAMASEVAALLADEPRRLAIAREAQRRAVADDADNTARRFEEAYVELVRQSRGARARPGMSASA